MKIKNYKDKYFHISNKPIDEVINTKNEENSTIMIYGNVLYNPKGLWLSCGTSWINFIIEKFFTNKYIFVNFIYEIKINKNDIKVINNKKEFNRFTKKYLNKKITSIKNVLDWKKIKKQYKGLIICPHLQNVFYEYSFIRPELLKNIKSLLNKKPKIRSGWYSGWDVASGVIWNPESIIDVIKINFI